MSPPTAAPVFRTAGSAPVPPAAGGAAVRLPAVRPRWRIQRAAGTPRTRAALARLWARLERSPSPLRHGAGPLRRLLARLPGADTTLLAAVFADGSRFLFPCHDRYWGKRLLCGTVYEPGIHALLHALRGVPFRFLDCGANFGYWSALVSGPELGAHPVLAVEAAPETLPILERTRAVNGHRFAIRACAVVGEPRATVSFTASGGHWGRHVAGSKIWADEADIVEVEARTLASLIAEFADPAVPLLVKLDVEGMEAEIVRNTPFEEFGEVALLFEDHGGPHAFAATAAARDRGMRVFRIAEDALHPVDDPARLADPERPVEAGYELLALPARPGAFDRALATAGADALP